VIDNTVLTPTTDAATFDFALPRNTRQLVSASGLDAEVVAIQILQGASYVDSGEELTSDTPALMLLGPGQFRLDKPITIAAGGLFLDFPG